ncbi:glycosyltransferase family 4 protein [Deinococcus aluminii]
MLRTKEALEQLGVVVRLAKQPGDLQGADLVHIFNTQRAEELLHWAQEAKHSGLPVALSTIHWDLSHYIYVANLYKLGIDCSLRDVSLFKLLFDLVAPIAGRLIGKPDYYSSSHRRSVKLLSEQANLLLPNSEEEARLFFKNYGLKKGKYRVVLNAIEGDLFKLGSGERTTDVICVGRIEPTKNQLGLLRAVAGRGWSTTLIGRDGENPRYSAALHQLAQAQRVQVLGNLPQSQVANQLRQAKVHVLASFRESPGLVTLEALAMGCNVVVADSRFCPVDTYFKDLLGRRVFVCNPYRSDSIALAIEQALRAGNQPMNYVPPQWSEVGQATLAAYRELM